MHAENLSKRENVSDLISMRMILNDSLSTFNDVSKSRTHVALLWASQANTLPATFWSLFYMIRYVDSSYGLYCVGSLAILPRPPDGLSSIRVYEVPSYSSAQTQMKYSTKI